MAIGYLRLGYSPCVRLYVAVIERSISTLDRESIANQYMDIHRNPWISTSISIETWIIEDLSIKNDIHLWIFIVYGYPLWNVLARISVFGYQCGYPRLYR